LFANIDCEILFLEQFILFESNFNILRQTQN